MDSDGTASKLGTCAFDNTNEGLADAVAELVTSLGWIAHRTKRPARLNGIDYGVVHHVAFRPTESVFRLERKASRFRLPAGQASRHTRRMVVAIEPVESVPVRCIEVDSDTHLYLAGRDLIPTHNTSAGVVLAEELIDAGQQVIVIDPTGVWWGLRADAAGAPSGLPVVIIGGKHGDLPLAETDGRALAQMLVAERQSAVIDLSGLSKTAARRAMADFMEDLYRYCEEPLQLIVDEADLFAPQRLPADMMRLLGAMDDVVRRGRAHGLGCTLISQRPAVLNKDVLSQAEVLVAMRMTSPRDVGAIDEWVSLHADDDEARTVKASLPSLPIGTAWVWSPGWLEILQRVAVRRRRTFDSSATPKPGKPRPKARLGATLDIDALRAHLDELVAAPPPAKGRRPAAVNAAATATVTSVEVRGLRAQVADLTARLREATERAPQTVVETVTVTVPVLDDDARAMLSGLVQRLEHATTAVAGLLSQHQPRAAPPAPLRPPQPARPPVAAPRPPAASTPASAAPVNAPGIRAGALRMLEAMGSYHPVTLTRAQLATVSKMKATGGTYSTYLSNLRSNGLFDEVDGRLRLTEAGLAMVGGAARDTSLTAEQVRAQWRSALRAGAARMFDVVVDMYPDGCTRADLAAAVDMEPSGGTFSTYLSILRSNGLVETHGSTVVASATLFMEPGRAS